MNLKQILLLIFEKFNGLSKQMKNLWLGLLAVAFGFTFPWRLVDSSGFIQIGVVGIGVVLFLKGLGINIGGEEKK